MKEENVMALRPAKVSWRRKHFIGLHPRDGEMIATVHEGPLSELLHDTGGWEETMLSDVAVLVPRGEFKEMVMALPEFEMLPIFWARWNAIGKPTEFLVKCFETEDELAVDTQGFDYARNKSAVQWV